MIIAKFFLHKFYFGLAALIFRLKSGVVAIGIKVDLHIYKKVVFGGKNRIGKNSKIIIPNKSNRKQFLLGKYSWIRENVEINAPGESVINIKQSVSVQDNCKILGDVTIESNCILAPDIFISSGTHSPFYNPNLLIREQDRLVAKQFGFLSKPVHIEEDCWIGKSVFIEPGAYIGRGCVIGSNARIKNNIPPYSVVVNNSTVLKKRVDFEPPSEITASEKFIPYFYRGFETTSQNIELGRFMLSQQNGIIILNKISTETKVIIQGINQSNNSISLTAQGTIEKVANIQSSEFKLVFTLSKSNENFDKLQSVFDYFILSLHCNDFKYLGIESVIVE